MELPASEKLVLLALAYRTDAKGFCFPSAPNIAKTTGLNVKTVRSVLAKLESDGYVRVTARPGKAAIYVINPTQKRVDPKTGTPENDSAQKRVDTLPKNGQTPYPILVDEQVKNKEITSKGGSLKNSSLSDPVNDKPVVDFDTDFEVKTKASQLQGDTVKRNIAQHDLMPVRRRTWEEFMAEQCGIEN